MTDFGNKTRQSEFLSQLLGGSTVRDAAKSMGISERTAYRWANSPKFLALANDVRKEVLDRAVNKITDLALLATNELGKLLSDPKSSVRLRAAEVILNSGFRLREQHELVTRLGTLEAIQRDDQKTNRNS